MLEVRPIELTSPWRDWGGGSSEDWLNDIVSMCLYLPQIRFNLLQWLKSDAKEKMIDARIRAVVEAIHSSPFQAVLFLSGGASQVLFLS